MTETADGRVYKRKRIRNANDESIYVDIPVIYQARFKSMVDQAQEFFIYFDNSENSSRKTHVKSISASFDNLAQSVQVERIDEWSVKIMQEQAQESTFVMKNTDPPPMQPDGNNNPSHEKTHIVRYYQNNDAGSQTWVDVELIDELKIKCMQEQAQEYIWFIKHPELGDPVTDSGVPYSVTVGYCDPSLELAN